MRAAPALRRRPVSAFAVLLAATLALLVSAQAPRAAVWSGERTDARLPSAVWAVGVDRRAARALTAARLATLRRGCINALVADPRVVRGKSLAALRRRAARARLVVLLPRSFRRKGVRTAGAALAACRGVSRCVVLASSARTAARLSRTAGVDLVVVRVSGPRAAAELSGSRARRVLALAPLGADAARHAPAWRAAIAVARGSAVLDLGVTSRSARALDAYLALLAESRGTPKPPPPRASAAASGSITEGGMQRNLKSAGVPARHVRRIRRQRSQPDALVQIRQR